MQTQKTDIRKIILEVARTEFQEKGFANASMRTIAGKSGVGLSNIYNYFKNKDEILLEALSPLMRTFDEMMNEHNNAENISLNVFSSDEFQLQNINMMVNLVETYRAELKLLLFHSHGSSLENFRDDFTNRKTENGMEYLRRMKEKYPHLNTNISEFFMHTITSWWISIIGEIVTHEELSHKEIEKFISEYIAFGTAGWGKIMDV